MAKNDGINSIHSSRLSCEAALARVKADQAVRGNYNVVTVIPPSGEVYYVVAGNLDVALVHVARKVGWTSSAKGEATVTVHAAASRLAGLTDADLLALGLARSNGSAASVPAMPASPKVEPAPVVEPKHGGKKA